MKAVNAPKFDIRSFKLMNIQSKTNNILQAAIKILCALAACAAVFVAIVFYKADVYTLLMFALFMVFGVLLPGNAILKNLGLESEHYSTELIRSFFTGFALNILIYYLSAVTRLYHLVFIIDPALSVLWFINARKEGFSKPFKKLTGALKDAPASFFVFTFLVFMYSMSATQLRYIAPEYSLFSLMQQDYGFHAGIINALAEGFPPQNPWIDGRIITYHYYTEMFLSIPVRLLGVTSDNLIMCCTPYLMAPVFSLSLFSFLREMTSDEKRTGLYCLAFFLSNMFILKAFGSSWSSYHLYSNMDSAGLGVACLLATIPLLREWEIHGKKDKLGGGKALLFSAFIMLMTGIKGPVAVVLVGGMTGTFILALIMKKANKRMAAATLLSVLSFILIYLFVLEAEHENASGGSVLNLGEVTDLFFLKNGIMQLGDAAHLPRMLTLLILLAIFTVFFFTAFLVPFAVGYIRELILVLSGKRDYCFSRITVYASVAVGFIALIVLNFSGHSQVYFGFAACALVPAIAFWYFEDVRENKGLPTNAVRAIFLVSLVFFSYTMGLYGAKTAGVIERYYVSNGTRTETYRNLSRQEYEGLIWLRDNTEKDALCASDRYNSVSMKDYDYRKRNNNTHFAYAIYSQRRQYLEGSGFSLFASQNDLRKKMLKRNRKMFDKDNAERGEFARQHGVDYVIVSKRFNDFGDLSNEDYELCFSNEDMDIYKVVYPEGWAPKEAEEQTEGSGEAAN